MDYKEKYEQAMLRMNKWVEGSEIIEPREVAEFVFPELKESEDERIRKELWEYFHNMQLSSDCDFSPSLTIDDILAWLEKQGEQKPTWSEEDKETFGYLEDVVDFCYRNQYVVNVQTLERVRQLVSRLKSLCFQSGWSKDDITRIDELIETLNIVQANRVRTQRMHYSKTTIDRDIDWLKSLKERMKGE